MVFTNHQCAYPTPVFPLDLEYVLRCFVSAFVLYFSQAVDCSASLNITWRLATVGHQVTQALGRPALYRFRSSKWVGVPAPRCQAAGHSCAWAHGAMHVSKALMLAAAYV